MTHINVVDVGPRLFKQVVTIERPEASKEADSPDYTFVTNDEVEEKVVERTNRPTRPKATTATEAKRKGRRTPTPQQG